MAQSSPEWWQIEEKPFRSDKPVVGPLIVRLRALWNSISTKWYVRPLIEQQNAVNQRLTIEIAHLQEELHVAQATLAALEQELAEVRRIQGRMFYQFIEELDGVGKQGGSPGDRREGGG
jgi:hypothetical protein